MYCINTIYYDNRPQRHYVSIAPLMLCARFISLEPFSSKEMPWYDWCLINCDNQFLLFFELFFLHPPSLFRNIFGFGKNLVSSEVRRDVSLQVLLDSLGSKCSSHGLPKLRWSSTGSTEGHLYGPDSKEQHSSFSPRGSRSLVEMAWKVHTLPFAVECFGSSVISLSSVGQCGASTTSLGVHSLCLQEQGSESFFGMLPLLLSLLMRGMKQLELEECNNGSCGLAESASSHTGTSQASHPPWFSSAPEMQFVDVEQLIVLVVFVTATEVVMPSCVARGVTRQSVFEASLSGLHLTEFPATQVTSLLTSALLTPGSLLL